MDKSSRPERSEAQLIKRASNISILSDFALYERSQLLIYASLKHYVYLSVLLRRKINDRKRQYFVFLEKHWKAANVYITSIIENNYLNNRKIL